MIKTVFDAGKKLPARTRTGVLCALMSEVGELSVEIAIEEGTSYKKPDVDGIVGESIDIIICAIDQIQLANPLITKEEILEIVKIKCDKWVDKTLEALIKNKS